MLQYHRPPVVHPQGEGYGGGPGAVVRYHRSRGVYPKGEQCGGGPGDFVPCHRPRVLHPQVLDVVEIQTMSCSTAALEYSTFSVEFMLQPYVIPVVGVQKHEATPGRMGKRC